jgi:hypothetical protein
VLDVSCILLDVSGELVCASCNSWLTGTIIHAVQTYLWLVMSAVVGHYHLTHPSKHTCMLHVLKAASQFPQHLLHAAHSVDGIDHRKAATMRSNSEKDVDAILSTSGVTRVYVYVEQQTLLAEPGRPAYAAKTYDIQCKLINTS